MNTQKDQQNQQASNASNASDASAQKEDYGDKAFGFISKKAGHPVDPNTSEKITDGARTAFEKATGKQVNSKFSN